MKRILFSLLVSIPFLSFASDTESEEQRIAKIQKAFSKGTNCANLRNVVLQNANLTNEDFATITRSMLDAETLDVSHNNINGFVMDIRPCASLTSLDLSDNKFTKSFSLSLVFSNFPQLETLKINNNAITGFDFKKGHCTAKGYSSSLNIVEARNTNVVAMDLKCFMTRIPLQILDLSDSQKLFHLYTSGVDSDNRMPLKVIVKNTKHDFSTRGDLKVYTMTAGGMLIASVVVGAGAGYFFGRSEGATVTGSACGLAIGLPLIHCLPNRGQKVVAEFVTK